MYAVDKHRQVFHGILRRLIWGKIISRGKDGFSIVPSTVLLVDRFFELQLFGEIPIFNHTQCQMSK